jgi:LPXTG-motif cell wall-anchored protein
MPVNQGAERLKEVYMSLWTWIGIVVVIVLIILFFIIRKRKS